MSRPTRATKRTPSKPATTRKKAAPKKTTAKKPDARTSASKKPSGRKTAPASSKAARSELRKQLPPDPRLDALWDRGAARAHAARAAAPLRVSLRSVHKKRLAAIESSTDLDRQTILNRALATGWETLQMNARSLDDAAARLRRQPSAAAGTVTLHPTAQTLQILRRANHPQARAILLQTGLNAWAGA